MCTRAECIEKLTQAAPFIRKEFGVQSMRLFGSMARGDNRPDSDVDVFVEMPPKIFRIIALQQYLEDILGVAVDVVRKHSNINNFFLKQVERDGITIFA
ncbi:MAG: nucleotidyltransferase family protein [Muribaculum sp.]|nr:nucleotidyltransferase family protein [Muribaculum sp.]